jgi:Zn-dependent protease with chaperone function
MNRYLLAGLGGFAAGLALALVATGAHAAPPTAPQPEPEAKPKKIVYDAARAQVYSRGNYVLYFVGEAWMLGALGLVALGGLSPRLRSLAERWGRSPPLRDALYTAGLVLLISGLAVPLALYSGLIREHQFGLSNQTLGAWAADYVKGMAVETVMAVPLALIWLAVVRRSPRRWWLWFTAVSLPLNLVFVVLAPVLIDPLFNRFTPLPEGPLRTAIVRLASRAGAGGADILVADRSRQTKQLNAYVWGLSGTKRIVLYDNLLRACSEREVLAILAHELGHYVKRHVWYGLLFSVGATGLGLGLASRVLPWVLKRLGDRAGCRELSDVASLPVVLLVLQLLVFLGSPGISAFSRSLETGADWYGLKLGQDGQATASAFLKLGAVNLTELHPPRFVVFWMFSHPPLGERLARAEGYSRGGDGPVAPTAGDGTRR